MGMRTGYGMGTMEEDEDLSWTGWDRAPGDEKVATLVHRKDCGFYGSS